VSGKGYFLSLTADRCQLNVGRHLDSRETDITGAEFIGAHTADAEVLKHREPTPTAKIFDFSLQREVNQELGIRSTAKEIGVTIPPEVLARANRVIQ
jgi:hypothetical protein